MQFGNMAGRYDQKGDTIIMIAQAGVALKFGDVVKLGTQVSGQPYVVVTTVAADDIGVRGVVSEPGGIALGAVGRVTIQGPALMNCDSQAAWAANLSINTNGITLAGVGNDGTAALGKVIGFSMGLESGTVTQQTVFVNPT
jgi:hypothetical protein